MKVQVLMAGLLLVGQATFASEGIGGGFGTDGASLESRPRKDSVQSAAQLFEGLNVKVVGNKKTVQAEDGEIICDQPGRGIHTFVAGCEFGFSSKIAKLTKAKIGSDVTFSGKIAEEIFRVLPADKSGRVGAVVKSAGNLSCSKAVRPGAKVTCILKGVSAIEI